VCREHEFTHHTRRRDGHGTVRNVWEREGEGGEVLSLSHLLMRVANSRFPLTPDEFDRTESGRDDDGPALLLLEARQARRCWACVCVRGRVCMGVVLCEVDDSTLSQVLAPLVVCGSE
jgi:hypothetical protein